MPTWRKSLYAIWAAELLALAGFNACLPILPFYLADLGVRDPATLKVWTGLAYSAGAIAMTVFSPIWGRVADMYGRRLMLLRSMLGGFVVMGLMGFATHPWQIVVLRGMQGALTGTIGAATVLVASITPESETGFGLGLLQTGVFVGASFGPLIGGTLSDALGYRAPFWLTSGLLVVAAVLVITLVKEDFTPAPREGSLLSRLLPDLGVFRRSKGLLTLLVSVGAFQIANSVVGPVIPLFIQSMAGGETTKIGTTTGLILGLSALSAAVASAAVGKISYRMGYRRALIVCVLGAALLTFPQALVRTPLQLLLLRVVGGFFLGGTSPTVNATIAALTDRNHHGAVYGFSSSISSAGMALGPMIGAGVGVALGFPSVFLTTAVILLGVGLFLARDEYRRAA